jgi:hypothetical protein
MSQIRYFISKVIVSNVPLINQRRFVHDHRKHFVACSFISYDVVYVFKWFA